MSFWIELHCDVKKSRIEKGRPACFTDRNDNHGGMARTATAIYLVKMSIQIDARQHGWVYKDRKWACPNCKDKG